MTFPHGVPIEIDYEDVEYFDFIIVIIFGRVCTALVLARYTRCSIFTLKIHARFYRIIIVNIFIFFFNTNAISKRIKHAICVPRHIKLFQKCLFSSTFYCIQRGTSIRYSKQTREDSVFARSLIITDEMHVREKINSYEIIRQSGWAIRVISMNSA